MNNNVHTHGHEHREATYAHILKYTGIFGGVEGLKMLVGLTKNKLTSIFLGSVGIGLGAIYANIIESVNSATNFGLSFSAMRSVSESFEENTEAEVREHVRVVRTWSLWTALLAALICSVGAPWITQWFFPEGGNTWLVAMLSLAVFAMPIEAGECAVLKGMRHLKRVAIIEILSVISTLLTTIPLYILLGINGVVYSLVLTQLAVTAVHLSFSVTVVPYRVSLCSVRVFREGLSLLRLGIPYAIAALAKAITMGAILHFIEDHSQNGLFKMGLLILSITTALAFTAMDADFFPRLSAANHDTQRSNRMINQQIDVCAMAMAPILLALLAGLPFLVPLLLTDEFLPIIGMCIFGVIQTYLRGLTTPLEYLPLAKGQSVVYLLVEIASHAITYAFILWLFPIYGLLGVGIAMALAQASELLLVYLLYCGLFGFTLSRCTFFYSMAQAVLLAGGTLLALMGSGWWQPAGIAVLALVSGLFSIKALGSESSVFQRVLHRGLHSNDHDCCGHS